MLILLGCALLLAGLVWLARREEQPPAKPVERPVETRVDQSAAAREQIEAFLAATAVPADAVTREPADRPKHYQIRYRSPSAKSVEELRQRLRRHAPPLVLSTPEDGVLTIVDSQGKTLLTIQYLPAPAPPKATPPRPGKVGRVAIIIDDLGRGLKQPKQLLAIRQPVTFAILAIEPHATEVARMAHAAGREVMLHVPMEPQGFPVVDPGDDALLVNQPDEMLRSQLQALLSRVPHAAGINNHMGSRFTEDERAMTAIMAELRDHGLFFVDSLTSGHSVGTATARQAGVPTLRRDVFLDNIAEVEPIVREIRRLADKARRNGSAVGICHPYPETIKALQQELPKLAAQGIEFVTVAELLKGG
ncbi:MAG: divergent polysaccharide deacetylase family protein [Desulfuromonadales bacterium]|nr:divergent polysaccharide deacetylase family protein [Desulfuromonadales bacterium]